MAQNQILIFFISNLVVPMLYYQKKFSFNEEYNNNYLLNKKIVATQITLQYIIT